MTVRPPQGPYTNKFENRKNLRFCKIAGSENLAQKRKFGPEAKIWPRSENLDGSENSSLLGGPGSGRLVGASWAHFGPMGPTAKRFMEIVGA